MRAARHILILFFTAKCFAQTTQQFARLNIPQLSKLADRGESAAQVELGRRYLLGQGAERDAAAAMSLFGKAAAAGSGDALYELHLCYRDGIGDKANSEKSAALLRQSVEAKYPRAIVEAAEKELPANDPAAAESALNTIADLARQGEPAAQLALGRAMAAGRNPKPPAGESIGWLLKAAAADDPRIALAAARIFRTGEGSLRADAQRAGLLLRRLAEQGVREAVIDLARAAPESFRGFAREYSADKIARDPKLIGAAVRLDGEVTIVSDEQWTIAGPPPIKVIPDAGAVENLQTGRFAVLAGVIEKAGVVRCLVADVPAPKYQISFTLTEPKVLKGTNRQDYVVGGQVRNNGRQLIKGMQLAVRVYQPDSGAEETRSVEIAGLAVGETRPFVVQVRPEKVQAQGVFTPAKAEVKVADLTW